MKKTATLFLLLFASVCVAQPFTGKPIYQILTKRAGITLGTTNIELFPNIAPGHVHNFDSLVNEHYFDTTAFHRVIPGFMIQGGDPNSRHGDIATWGFGDPSQPTVDAEFSVAKHLRGIVSAARDADTNSANSQFFICVAAAPWLNGQYSVYGRTVSGMNIVDTIVNSPRDANDNPLQKIEMFVSYVGSNDTVPNAPALVTPLDYSVVTTVNKTLKWATVPDGIIYRLEVSTDSTFSTLYKKINVAGVTNALIGMTTGTTYYWRVRANNGGHFSAWSPTWRFNVNTSTGIDDPTEPAEQIIVAPNPSRGVFTFSNISKDEKIKVYDITGRVIYTGISNGNSFTVDLQKNEKGIYFYQLENSQRGKKTGKLVIE